jgi:SAM-dependent methyltransferase
VSIRGSKQERQDLIRIAERRLRPSLTNPHYLVLRRRTQLLSAWIQQFPGNNLCVLDIGGRYQPYRPLLQDRATKYIALDVLRTEFVDVVGRGEQLPFRTSSFDLVIATGVFEYFPQPHVAAQQIYDALKPGGALLLSVGAVSPRFVEAEHWRYMRSGLRSVLSPFADVEIVPEVFSLGGFCRIVNASMNIFAKLESIRTFMSWTVFPCVNVMGMALEGSGLSTNDQLAGNYSAFARK